MKKLSYALISTLAFCITSCTVNEQTDELETTWVFWVLLAAVAIGLIAGFYQSKKTEEANKERGKMLKKATEEFNVSAKVVGVNNRYQFIVDDVDKNIIFMESFRNKKIVPYDKIMSVEMIEDNTMISSKSLGRTIGGAIIGDIIAGEAGMIVGGLSGDSMQKKKVSRVEVVIKMRDFNDPALRIPCFDAVRETNNAKKEIKPGDGVYGPMYDKSLEDAVRITELVSIIIDQMDKAAAQQIAAPSPAPSTADENTSHSMSIANEIKKLAEMKAEGLITKEEFVSLKSKLIK